MQNDCVNTGKPPQGVRKEIVEAVESLTKICAGIITSFRITPNCVFIFIGTKVEEAETEAVKANAEIIFGKLSAYEIILDERPTLLN